MPVPDASDLTEPGTALGTLAYLAPERLRGEPGGPAADVFALATVAYLGLTGRLPRPSGSLRDLVAAAPFRSPAVSTVAPGLGREFDDALFAGLAVDPGGRPDALGFGAAPGRGAGPVDAERTAGRRGQPRWPRPPRRGRARPRTSRPRRRWRSRRPPRRRWTSTRTAGRPHGPRDHAARRPAGTPANRSSGWPLTLISIAAAVLVLGLIGSRLLSAAPTSSAEPGAERRRAGRVAVRGRLAQPLREPRALGGAVTRSERPRRPRIRPSGPSTTSTPRSRPRVAGATGSRARTRTISRHGSRWSVATSTPATARRPSGMRGSWTIESGTAPTTSTTRPGPADRRLGGPPARPRGLTRRRPATDRRIMARATPAPMTRTPMTAETQTPADRLRPLRRTRQVRQFEPAPVDRAHPRRARRRRPLDREQQQQPAVAVHRDHGAVDAPRPPRSRPAADARPRDRAGGDRDRPPVRSRGAPSTTPTTTGASPSGCSSPPRSSTSAPGSAGSARTSARQRTGSSASPTDGWSGRSSSSAIRLAEARAPKSRAGRGPPPAKRDGVRGALAGRLTATARAAGAVARRRDAAPLLYGPLTRSGIGGSGPSYPPPR